LLILILYENCFRVVNIAYINEIADLCKYKGIDVKEVIAASSTKPFGFMAFEPGHGIGGVCLPQNPYFLMKNLDNAEKTLPILSKSITVLNNRPYCNAYKIKYDNIFFIGVGYKKNQMLTAYSPALTLYNELLHRNKKVYLYDPLNNINSDFDFTLDNLLKYDCIILGNKMDCIDYKILEQYKKHKEVIEY
jgi:UDP-N-acetyl-D-glucosamine dehydrogenase